MNILLDVLRWCFIAGFASVFGFFALIGGLTAGAVVFVVCADGIIRLKGKISGKHREDGISD